MSKAYSWLLGPMPSNPDAYRDSDGTLRDWNTGLPVEWRKSSMLVRDEAGRDSWTWEDETGQRHWAVVG